MKTSLHYVYVVIALSIVLIATLHAIFLSPPIFPVDDAYITLHNAQVLLTGQDSNYPGIPALTGATSAIHLALVAGLLTLFPPLWALQTAAWTGVLLYTLGLARLVCCWGGTSWHVLLFVCASLLVGRTPHMLLNGLETGLAMAGLTWALALASDPTPRRWWLLPLICGQLPFLRPELVVASFFLIVLQGWHTLREKTWQEALQCIMRHAVVFIASAAPWMLWYILTLEIPYPSTVVAKRAFFAEGCLPAMVKLDWVWQQIRLFATTLGIFSFTAFLLLWTSLGWCGLVCTAALFGAYYIHFPGALGHYEQRYLYSLLPFLLYGIASTFTSYRRWLRMVSMALLLTGLVQSAYEFRSRFDFYLATRHFTSEELDGVAQWIRAHTPPNAIFLIHDTGYVAYTTAFRLVDFVGLKTPSSIALHQQKTWPSCGRERGAAVHEIALRSSADYFIMLRGWDGIYHLTDTLRAEGWQLALIRPEGAYQVYRLTPPSRLTMEEGRP